jgi:2-polyprenyl-3-methyl-5-hydroxy-6-metoxy-1,4-benzoquinol methylase
MEVNPSKKIYRWVAQVCPICEIPPQRRLGRRGGTAHRLGAGVECDVWQCEKCSLIFPNPMPIPIGGLEQHYAVPPEEYFQRHELSAKDDYAQLLMSQLRSLNIKTGRLLDIGTGRGEVLRAAKLAGWDTVGIETSSTFAAYAAKYAQSEILQKPLEECCFADESFDVVVLGAVLEHLYNPNETIREVARILRPGGALFVDVPNERGLYFILGNLYQKIRLRDWVVNLAPTFEPYHVFGFTPKSLRALLSKHGLQPRIWYIFSVKSMLTRRQGIAGPIEQAAARLVTAITRSGELGEYIVTWAIKT